MIHGRRFFPDPRAQPCDDGSPGCKHDRRSKHHRVTLTRTPWFRLEQKIECGMMVVVTVVVRWWRRWWLWDGDDCEPRALGKWVASHLWSWACFRQPGLDGTQTRSANLLLLNIDRTCDLGILVTGSALRTAVQNYTRYCTYARAAAVWCSRVRQVERKRMILIWGYFQRRRSSGKERKVCR